MRGWARAASMGLQHSPGSWCRRSGSASIHAGGHMTVQPAGSEYPARLTIDYAEQHDRARTFLRVFMVLPIGIVLAVLTAGANETVYDRSGELVRHSSGGIAVGLFIATLLMIVFRQRYVHDTHLTRVGTASQRKEGTLVPRAKGSHASTVGQDHTTGDTKGSGESTSGHRPRIDIITWHCMVFTSGSYLRSGKWVRL